MSAAKQLALMAGIPVEKHKGKEVVRVNQATARYLFGPRAEVLVGPVCSCLSFRLAHDPKRHRELRGDWDWRTWEQRGDVGERPQQRRRPAENEVPPEILEEWYA